LWNTRLFSYFSWVEWIRMEVIAEENRGVDDRKKMSSKLYRLREVLKSL